MSYDLQFFSLFYFGFGNFLFVLFIHYSFSPHFHCILISTFSIFIPSFFHHKKREIGCIILCFNLLRFFHHIYFSFFFIFVSILITYRMHILFFYDVDPVINNLSHILNSHNQIQSLESINFDLMDTVSFVHHKCFEIILLKSLMNSKRLKQ